MEVIIIVLIVLILAILVSCIKIVPQAQAYVVERLGAYQGTWSACISKCPLSTEWQEG